MALVFSSACMERQLTRAIKEHSRELKPKACFPYRRRDATRLSEETQIKDWR